MPTVSSCSAVASPSPSDSACPPANSRSISIPSASCTIRSASLVLCFFLAQHRRMTDDSLVRTGNLWSSWLHHSRFSSVSPAEALSRMNNRLEQTERNTPDWLFITLGTAWVYEWKLTGEVVANCHKMPDHLFRRRLLSVSEGVETLSDAIRQFREVSPNLSVVLTVSPVRHLRDGAHGNQISKSTLLLICSELCSLPFVDYFPAYELLMDDLRDYRFYADDLVHPSSEAQEYVWQKWCDAFLSDSARQIGQEAEKMLRGMSHRPLRRPRGIRRFLPCTQTKDGGFPGSAPRCRFP